MERNKAIEPHLTNNCVTFAPLERSCLFGIKPVLYWVYSSISICLPLYFPDHLHSSQLLFIYYVLNTYKNSTLVLMICIKLTQCWWLEIACVLIHTMATAQLTRSAWSSQGCCLGIKPALSGDSDALCMCLSLLPSATIFCCCSQNKSTFHHLLSGF